MIKFTPLLIASLMGMAAATDAGIEAIVERLMEKMEDQWQVIESQSKDIYNLKKVVAEQEETLAESLEMITELRDDLLKTRSSDYGRQLQFSFRKDDDDCLPYFNHTLDKCVFKEEIKFKENVGFHEHVDFEGTTFFNADVTIDDHSKLIVNGKADFDDDILVEGDATFKGHSRFYSDVTIDGPPTNRDAIEFIIKDNVEVTFEQDTFLLVDTESLFRDDVTIALDEDDVRRRKLDHQNMVSRRHQPKLKVAGDTILEDVVADDLIVQTLEVLGETEFSEIDVHTAKIDTLTVKKKAEFESDVDISGDLDVNGKIDTHTLEATSAVIFDLAVPGPADIFTATIENGVMNNFAAKASAQFGPNDIGGEIPVQIIGSLTLSEGVSEQVPITSPSNPRCFLFFCI